MISGTSVLTRTRLPLPFGSSCMVCTVVVIHFASRSNFKIAFAPLCAALARNAANIFSMSEEELSSETIPISEYLHFGSLVRYISTDAGDIEGCALPAPGPLGTNCAWTAHPASKCAARTSKAALAKFNSRFLPQAICNCMAANRSDKFPNRSADRAHATVLHHLPRPRGATTICRSVSFFPPGLRRCRQISGCRPF
jgi:hypothetical protein